MVVTDKEEKLIEEIRKIPFGQVVVYMQEGQPVRIEIKESVKL